MDRDNRWDRVEKAYAALTKGEGIPADSAVQLLKILMLTEKPMNLLFPAVVMENGVPTATIKDKDSIIFYNFRPDRAREITRAFCADEFDGFDRGKRLDVTYICFTEYDVTIPNKEIAFKKVEIKNTFGEFLAAHHMTQGKNCRNREICSCNIFL